ncbi:hypothetical protein UFOVP20_19 [uncultured Caudovirales phage]|uniref:Uncharacterized protein n=1 Tax=uncultured Caudovirales phage TaxID=2100421 RepID=A0A6J5KIF0_9CAUD|nr:hypothetical protein UFOVP20_19 [uncultured Caudovirales phage]
MKAALITEEQIKAIQDALSVVEGSLIARGVLDIMKSLKVQEPVAWGVESESGDIIDCITPAMYLNQPGDYAIPLYALGDEK